MKNDLFNLELEKHVLGGMIRDTDHCQTGLDMLSISDFHKTFHQQVFQAALDLSARKEPVDLVTVATRLKTVDGYASQLADIGDYFPSNMTAYCRKLKDLATRREAKHTALKFSAECDDPTVEISELLDRFQAAALGLDGGQDAPFQDMPTLAIQTVNRYGHKHERTGIKTGFSVFDSLTGGLGGSAFMIISARPSMGKTSMAVSMTRNIARAGHHVGIFSIEMDGQQLMDRLFSMETGINSVRLSTRAKITREEADRITAAAESIAAWPILIDDTGGLSISELKRRCRRMKKAGVEIIFIDQLSKITGGQGRSEYEKKTDVVNQVAALAKELRIPVVLLAQINRNIESRADKAPTLADLKSTGALEEDADMILLGHREYVYSQDPADKYRAQWELAKHRAGPTRKIEMAWNPKLTLFEDLRN